MPKINQSLRVSGLENQVLAALPDTEYQRLLPHLEPVSFMLSQIIYHSAQPLEYLYFPTSVLVSLLHTLENGTTAEAGLTGREGVVGIAVFLGGETTPNQAVVQIAGDAVRVRAKIIQTEFHRSEALQRLLLRYTQALITQISQTAVCNRLHSVEQRFCRWLLLSHDHVQSDQLIMTQELIASMLGGRRESVTVAAGQLQDLELLRYSRGHITILDRPGLEAMVCECYRVVKDEYGRLLPLP